MAKDDKKKISTSEKTDKIEEMSLQSDGSEIEEKTKELKNKLSVLETKVKELERKNKELVSEQEKIERKEKDISEKEKKINEEKERQNSEKKELKTKEKEVEAQKNEIISKSKELLNKERDLVLREENAKQGFLKENIDTWNKFIEEITVLKDGVEKEIERLKEQETEILKAKVDAIPEMKENLEKYIEEIKKSYEKNYELEIKPLELQKKKYEDLIKRCSEKHKEYVEKVNNLSFKEIEIREREDELDMKLSSLENEKRYWKQSLKEDEDEKDYNNKLILEKMKKGYKQELQMTRDELNGYKEAEIKILNEYNLQDIESIKQLANDMYELRKEKRELDQKIANMPSSYDLDELDSKREIIKGLNEELKEKTREIRRLQVYEAQITNQDVELYGLKRQRDFYENRYKSIMKTMEEETNRMKDLNRDTTVESVRLSSVNSPYFDIEDTFENSTDLIATNKVSEIKWLDEIAKKCESSGYVFDKRLLYSFHTSLKISDWSPLTVLAGISGIGKSSLPRLYSRFGGFYFLMVPVQPDWDSPQSIFGYFNSIDNKFNATSLLRAMVQGSTDMENNLKDRMIMVLLDEMNLAHVELYFSDMLSKLEERRDKNANESTSIEIDIGAGMDKHKIELTKNIFWVGTMNEDETTQSLSDKVVDRGNLITFAAPKTFVSRTKIDMANPTGKLPLSIWKEWLNSRVEFGKEIDEYKKALENINVILGHFKKQLGNRVWQSVENYMANHPLVIEYKDDEKKYAEAMELAFEDAVVQKVMPKLRGIDLEGDSLIKLEEIGKELTRVAPGIAKDYKTACENLEGAFVWSSSEYLNNFMEQDNNE